MSLINMVSPERRREIVLSEYFCFHFSEFLKKFVEGVKNN